MGNLFKDSKREDFSNIEKWDTSNVIDIGGMFDANGLAQKPKCYK